MNIALAHLAKDRAMALEAKLAKALLAIPETPENRQVVQGDGIGKLRAELKKKGLIGMGRADDKGRALVWRTPLGVSVSKYLEKHS